MRLALTLILFLVGGLAATGSPQTALGATFDVNSATDAVDANPGDGVCASAAGECTLRAAIQETNALPGADVVQLPAASMTLSIAGAGEDAGATGDLDVVDNLEIRGEQTVVDAGGVDRVLHLLGSRYLVIESVSIKDGAATSDFAFGGGVRNDNGALTIRDSIISQNHADAYGGGIFSGADSQTTIIQSDVQGNEARDGAGLYTVDGAEVLLDRSSIADNSASSAGGGVANGGFATLRISKSAITGNVAGAEGGGIANYGGVVLTDSTITGNTGAAGGGVFTVGDFFATGADIKNNTAMMNGGGIHHGGQLTPIPLQGGVPPASPGPLTVVASNLSLNTAEGFGGGMFLGVDTASVVQDTTVSGNRAADSGGIHNFGDLQVIASTIYANEARFGGGIGNRNELKILNSTVSGNAASIPDECPTCGASLGGGLLNMGEASISSSTVAFNKAEGGGGVYTIGAASTGLLNSIVGLNQVNDCAGTAAQSLGHNVFTGDSCVLAGARPGDIVVPDPLLAPLASNGGPTATHALLTGSPAIDAADNATCPVIDQRGQPRPRNGSGDSVAVCDMGAYELQTPIPGTPTTSPGPSPASVPKTGGRTRPAVFPVLPAVAGLVIVAITTIGATVAGSRRRR